MTDLFSGKISTKSPYSYLPRRYGWVAVPNCRSMQIIPGWYNEIWESLGVKVKNKPHFKFIADDLKHNKYVVYQIRRLDRLRSNPDQFFKVVFLLIEKSWSFRFSAMHHVIGNWYKSMPVKKVIHINNKVTKLMKERSFNLISKRVYIPKGESWRPLGVPTIEWRILLHMLNNFLVQFMKDGLLKEQHGFVRRKGSLTAWRQVFRYIDHPYIYECDLKQFFPSVKHMGITLGMMIAGIPSDIIRWIDNINCATPTLPKKRLLDESEVLRKRKEVRSEVFGGVRNPKPTTMRTGLGSSFGVPQGLPISPFLSILTLKGFLSQALSVSYADDPIFFGNKAFEIEDDSFYGIEIHSSKSHWVRRDGKWLTKLKYLGLEYDPYLNCLRTSTRKPKDVIELHMSKVIEILKAFGLRHEDRLDSTKNWWYLFRSKQAGIIISKLYGGTWERVLFDVPEGKIHKRSWMNQKWYRSVSEPEISTKAYKDYPNLHASKIRKVPSICHNRRYIRHRVLSLYNAKPLLRDLGDYR